MALAYGNFQELIHQIRFLFFEIGIAMSESLIEQEIINTNRSCLQNLHELAISEGLIAKPLKSHAPKDLVEQLEREFLQSQEGHRFGQWKRLGREIDVFIVYKTLTHLYHQRWQKELRQQTQEQNFWQWLQKSQRKDLWQFLCQWGAVSNELLSPSLSKNIFDKRELLHYLPEFNAQFSLHWCGIRKTEKNAAYANFMRKAFIQDYASWQQKLSFKQLPADDYVPIPIHPWFWRNKLQYQLAPLIDSKQLILIPHHQLVKPLLSESLEATASPAPYLIQLPLENHHSTLPQDELILLNQQLRQDSAFNALFILTKSATHSGEYDFMPQFYEHPEQFIQSNQSLVPFSTLFTHTPDTERPLLLDILNASHLSPSAYFLAYCEQVVKNILLLATNYGCCVDFTVDDLFLIIENNKPCGLVIKPQRVIHYDKETGLFIHTLAQTLCIRTIVPLVNCMHQYNLLPKKVLWSLVRTCLSAEIARLPIEKQALAREIVHQLLSSPWYESHRLTPYLFPALKTQNLRSYYENPLPNDSLK